MKYSKEKIQLVEEHSPVTKNFSRLKVIIKGLDECWQADLIDMKAHSKLNHRFKYILTVIDNLSNCVTPQDKSTSRIFTLMLTSRTV